MLSAHSVILIVEAEIIIMKLGAGIEHGIKRRRVKVNNELNDVVVVVVVLLDVIATGRVTPPTRQ